SVRLFPYELSAWRTRPNRQFRARREIEVVFAGNINRTSSARGADDSTDHCADCSADACARDRLSGLVVTLRAAFVINFDRVVILSPNSGEYSGEPIGLTVPQTDRIKVECHSGSAGKASTLINTTHRAFDNRAVVLTIVAHSHRKRIALL